MKYVGVKNGENLNWKDQTCDIVTKLNRANVLLYKVRNYINYNTLKVIYFAIFDYGHLAWGQNLKFQVTNYNFTEKLSEF